MTTQMTTTDIAVKMVLDRWNGSIENFNKHLDALGDAQLEKEVAPGKNRGIYLLGHLIAVHDSMLILMDMGPKLFPELEKPFIHQADRQATDIPSAAQLRKDWKTHCGAMDQKFRSMNTDAWFEKHTAVSAEDFAKEPHRNKLNIVITRTSHLQYHTGQLALLHEKADHNG